MISGLPCRYGHIHQKEDSYEFSEYYCPNCGKQEVWVAMEGDFYTGPEHVCLACNTGFTLPSGAEPANDPIDLKHFQRMRDAAAAMGGNDAIR